MRAHGLSPKAPTCANSSVSIWATTPSATRDSASIFPIESAESATPQLPRPRTLQHDEAKPGNAFPSRPDLMRNIGSRRPLGCRCLPAILAIRSRTMSIRLSAAALVAALVLAAVHGPARPSRAQDAAPAQPAEKSSKLTDLLSRRVSTGKTVRGEVQGRHRIARGEVRVADRPRSALREFAGGAVECDGLEDKPSSSRR